MNYPDVFEHPGLYSRESAITSYLRNLPQYKPTLPHGQPVCVSVSPKPITTAALLRLASAMGPYIAVLRLHTDNIVDWSVLSAQRLTNIAEKFSFLIWEGGRVLNTQGRSGQTEPVSEEDITESIDMARKRYTRGQVSIVSWASLASSWLISSDDHREHAAALVPELRRAARDRRRSLTTTSVHTEITAGAVTPDATNGGMQEVIVEANAEDQDDSDGIPGPLEDDSDMAHNLRNLASISLTHTVTQHTEVLTTPSSEDFEDKEVTAQKYTDGAATPDSNSPLPPLQSRGVVLCLPTEYTRKVDQAYKKAVFHASLEHGDFAIGFLTDEEWVDMCRHEKSQSSNEDPNDDVLPWTPERTRAFVVFGPVDHNRGSRPGDSDGQASNLPAMQSRSISADQPVPSAHSRQIDLLHDVVGRAVAVRNRTFPTRGNVSRNEGVDILYIPIISMNA